MPLAQKYDEFYAASDWRPREIAVARWPRGRMQAVLATDISGDIVLDVGCGDGVLLYQLRQRFSQLWGLEYSPQRLQQAQQNLKELRFTGFIGSAEDMSEIAANSVDVIVSADTIEHVTDVYAATAEMFRVLKPGGILVINTPNIAYIKRRLQLLLGRFPATSQGNEGLGSDVLYDGGHLHYFTFRSLKGLLERAGFVVEKRMGYGKFGRVHSLWPSSLSVGVQLLARK